MIENKMAITENEFMPKEKIKLLKVATTLAKLGKKCEIMEEILERSGREPGKRLNGLPEKLSSLRDTYSEESFGYECIQSLIDDLNGGNE